MKSDREYCILLVEDDINMGFLLAEFLEENNFKVKLCKDGESGLQAWNNQAYDFCIFDVMLPKLDGFSLTKKIRMHNKSVPILLLTAKSMKEDKIKGFNLGIDDYLTKPFDEEELLCRIHAILARTQSSVNTACEKISKIGKFSYDAENQSLVYGSLVFRLTKKENEILNFLNRKKNKITKREELLHAVWGNSDYFTGRSLDVFITKLRKYFKNDPAIKIEGIPTVGYILTDK
jgi:DNA-binding response OmpR family regulator